MQWLFVRRHCVIRSNQLSKSVALISKSVALTVNGQISKLTVFIILHIFFSTLAVLKIGDIQSQHI